MINYYRNQKVIKRWINNLFQILKYQRNGLYENISKDFKLNYIIQVLEEYDEIIFQKEEI